MIRDGIRHGTSAADIARDLERYLNPDYAPTKYRQNGKIYRRNMTDKGGRGYGSSYARTLARTEISQAHLAATREAAKITPGCIGVQWRLSGSHPDRDPCDDRATQDRYGLGPGVYPAKEYPDITHPNCLCTAVPVMASREDVLDEIVRKYGVAT